MQGVNGESYVVRVSKSENSNPEMIVVEPFKPFPISYCRGNTHLINVATIFS